MNIKRFVAACVVVFLFGFFFDWFFHGVVMKESYAQTAHLWRTQEEMGSHFGWLVLGQLLQTILFCLIYTRAESAKQAVGFAAGYGLAIGILLGAGESIIGYAVQPLPLSLAARWFVGGLVRFTIAGVILGAIYRPAQRVATVEGTPPLVAR